MMIRVIRYLLVMCATCLSVSCTSQISYVTNMQGFYSKASCLHDKTGIWRRDNLSFILYSKKDGVLSSWGPAFRLERGRFVQTLSGEPGDWIQENDVRSILRGMMLLMIDDCWKEDGYLCVWAYHSGKRMFFLISEQNEHINPREVYKRMKKDQDLIAEIHYRDNICWTILNDKE